VTDPRPRSGDGEEHDAWLRQALQHAPDAAAAPPDALREAILAEARSAARARSRAPSTAPRGRSPLDAIADFWSWLARPPVAAGFASVMAATIVGLMWWDRPMDEALPPPASSSRVEAPALAPPATTAAPAPAPAPMFVSKAAPAPTLRTPAEPQAAQPAPRLPLATPTAAPTGRLDAALQKTAPTAGGVDAPRKDRESVAPGAAETLPARVVAAPVAPAPAPFPATPTPAGAGSLQERIAPAATLARKAEKEAPEGALRGAAEPAAVADATKRADAAPAEADRANATAAATKPASLARQRGAAAARETTADSLDSRVPSTPPAAFAAAPPPIRDEAAASERRAAVNAPARPMAPLFASIAKDAEHWTRLNASGEDLPLDAATQAWLASVDAAAATRWQGAAERAGRLESGLVADPRVLVIGHDGRLAASVRIEEGGVFYASPAGPVWFAPLPAETVARLRATLPATAR
jgi:hypothetical protein